MSNQRQGSALWAVIGLLIVIGLLVTAAIVVKQKLGTTQPQDVTAFEVASGGMVDVLDVDVTEKLITVYVRLLGSVDETDRVMAGAFDDLIKARYDNQETVALVFVGIRSDGSPVVLQVNVCDAREMVLRGAAKAVCEFVPEAVGSPIDKSHIRWANSS